MGSASRPRVGIIVDRMTLARWQAEALRTLVGQADLLVYNCDNGKPPPRRLRYAFYYLLNLFTVRNPLTRRIPWPSDLSALEIRKFEARYDGAWQELPDELIQQLRSDKLNVIVKLGMGLLRVPSEEQLPAHILSYHHGDPARFRGRPAGYYEMLAGEPVMGQVVQRLSNRLDAGEIVASAQTKVVRHSYRSTLVESYRHSPLILRSAIANSLEGRSWTPPRWGQNHRLPSNSSVLGFLLKQWRRAAKHLLYGMFQEKRWRVATVALDSKASLDGVVQALARSSRWEATVIPPGYRFLADPFFHPDGGLLVEGFNSRSHRGEILHLEGEAARRVSGRGGHFSYPATIFDGRQWHMIPEISECSSAKSFLLDGDTLGAPAELRIPGRPRLLDPTPFQHDGTLYLFANLAEEGQSVLRLWMSSNLADEFAEHPASPIRISPQGSRMAGSIAVIDGELIRVGQDLRRAYGDGLSFFRIRHIDPLRYKEEWIRDFRFEHCKGPHTLNLKNGRAAFDFYDEGFSLFAGIRRIRERRAAGRSD